MRRRGGGCGGVWGIFCVRISRLSAIVEYRAHRRCSVQLDDGGVIYRETPLELEGHLHLERVAIYRWRRGARSSWVRT
jgi:hypothetical protein